jgi:hypothetical protein
MLPLLKTILSLLLALPKPKTNYLKRSFKYSGAMLWNSFPAEAKKASSLYQFNRSMSSIPETQRLGCELLR